MSWIGLRRAWGALMMYWRVPNHESQQGTTLEIAQRAGRGAGSFKLQALALRALGPPPTVLKEVAYGSEDAAP